MELILRLKPLNAKFPGLAQRLYLVSCEEAVEDIEMYINEALSPEFMADSLEKEHVMVALKLNVAGRPGVLICDPGYHVARVVTVMQDYQYPHTGWFTQSDEEHLRREYCYSFSAHSSHYIEWAEKQIRGGKTSGVRSLVYVQRPYRTAVDVTVRRNLVYNFRSLLARDIKGQVVAGIYFPVQKQTDSEVTLFFESASSKQKVKHKFSAFQHSDKIAEPIIKQLTECSSQLNLCLDELVDLLSSLSIVMADQDFIQQLLAINDVITKMSADN